MKSVAKSQEVRKEEVAVDISGTREDRYGARHIAVGCRRQPKERTQGDDGPAKIYRRPWIVDPLVLRQDTRQRHQRTKQEPVATPGKQGDILWCWWTYRRAWDREANSRVFCQDSKNECQDIVGEYAPTQT
jgi:hypothetical protein